MNDAELAIALAEEGAKIVRRCFGTELRRVDKSAGDFATNADLEAEAAMCALLRTERPNDCIVGEETGKTGPRGASRTWFIDPLCGTLNYAAKMRVVSVNVALRVGDAFVAAAVADPFSDEIFWANDAAAHRRAEGRDIPLEPSASSRLVDLNLDPPFPNAPAFRATTLAADSAFASTFRPRVVSTSMALAWVATGQRAAYVTDGDVRNSVHFAAGLALCSAAGCVVTDLKGRQCGQDASGLVAAADTETHDALMVMIRKYLN